MRRLYKTPRRKAETFIVGDRVQLTTDFLKSPEGGAFTTKTKGRVDGNIAGWVLVTIRGGKELAFRPSALKRVRKKP